MQTNPIYKNNENKRGKKELGTRSEVRFQAHQQGKRHQPEQLLGDKAQYRQAAAPNAQTILGGGGGQSQWQIY